MEMKRRLRLYISCAMYLLVNKYMKGRKYRMLEMAIKDRNPIAYFTTIYIYIYNYNAQAPHFIHTFKSVNLWNNGSKIGTITYRSLIFTPYLRPFRCFSCMPTLRSCFCFTSEASVKFCLTLSLIGTQSCLDVFTRDIVMTVYFIHNINILLYISIISRTLIYLV